MQALQECGERTLSCYGFKQSSTSLQHSGVDQQAEGQHLFSCTMKPLFGSMSGLATETTRMALSKGNRSFHIR